MDSLRQLIKFIILESSKTVDQASTEGLALVQFEGVRGSTFLLLFDPKKLEDYIELNSDVYPGTETVKWTDPEFSKDQLTDIVYGQIEFGEGRDKGLAYGASEVYTSSAKKGYGPLMYDMAMEVSGLLMSDRRSISDNAKSVWKKYKERSDVSKLKIDDVENPKTPEKVDDGVIFQSSDDSSLNYVYKQKKDLNLRSLFQRGDIFWKKYGKEISGLFYRLGTDYFRNRYFHG